MFCHPSTQIDFGVHKGLEISKIYKFDPSYLEWAIEFIPEFEIDIVDFENLPKPTPYDKKMSVYKFSPSEYAYCINSKIRKAEIFVQSGNHFKELDFQFSNLSKEILIQKQLGMYVCPNYERVKFNVIKIGDLLF